MTALPSPRPLVATPGIAHYLAMSGWTPDRVPGWAKRNGYSLDEGVALRAMVADKVWEVPFKSQGMTAEQAMALPPFKGARP